MLWALLGALVQRYDFHGAPRDLLMSSRNPVVLALLEAPKRQAERLRERLGA